MAENFGWLQVYYEWWTFYYFFLMHFLFMFPLAVIYLIFLIMFKICFPYRVWNIHVWFVWQVPIIQVYGQCLVCVHVPIFHVDTCILSFPTIHILNTCITIWYEYPPHAGTHLLDSYGYLWNMKNKLFELLNFLYFGYIGYIFKSFCTKLLIWYFAI